MLPQSVNDPRPLLASPRSTASIVVHPGGWPSVLDSSALSRRPSNRGPIRPEKALQTDRSGKTIGTAFRFLWLSLGCTAPVTNERIFCCCSNRYRCSSLRSFVPLSTCAWLFTQNCPHMYCVYAWSWTRHQTYRATSALVLSMTLSLPDTSFGSSVSRRDAKFRDSARFLTTRASMGAARSANRSKSKGVPDNTFLRFNAFGETR